MPERRGLLRLASRYLREALRSFVGRPDASNRLRDLAVECFDSGHEELAVRCFRRAAKTAGKPGLGDAWLGELYYERSRYGDARGAFGQAVDDDPGNPVALRGLAMSCHMLGDYDEATYYYLATLATNADDLESRINLGLAYYVQGRLDDAIQQFEWACHQDKHDFYPHYALGRALYDRSDFEGATASLERAIEINPAHSDAYLRLGMAQEALLQMENANVSYRRAVELDPGDPYARLKLADLLTSQGDPDGALEHASVALRVFGEAGDREEQARAQWVIGWAHYVKREWKQSAAASAAGLQLDPELAPVGFNLGVALLRDGRIDEARRVYEQTLSTLTDPWDLTAHAIGDLEKARAEDPGLEGAQEILGQLRAKHRELVSQLRTPDEIRGA